MAKVNSKRTIEYEKKDRETKAWRIHVVVFPLNSHFKVPHYSHSCISHIIPLSVRSQCLILHFSKIEKLFAFVNFSKRNFKRIFEQKPRK